MKITKRQLRRLIKEELESVIEQSNEKPSLNFYENPKGFRFRAGGAIMDRDRVDIEDIAARLKEGGFYAGGENVTNKPGTGVVIDMNVVRGGSPEDYEDLMRRISERLKDSFSLTFNYSKGDQPATKRY